MSLNDDYPLTNRSSQLPVCYVARPHTNDNIYEAEIIEDYDEPDEDWNRLRQVFVDLFAEIRQYTHVTRQPPADRGNQRFQPQQATKVSLQAAPVHGDNRETLFNISKDEKGVYIFISNLLRKLLIFVFIIFCLIIIGEAPEALDLVLKFFF